MNREFIFHIGYHKTASTFFQQNVFPNLNLDYVFLRGDLLRAFLYSEQFNERYVLTKIIDLIREKEGRRLLISQEALSGHPHGYSTIDPFVVAERIKFISSEAKVLCLIREQFSFLTSLYAYRVCVKGREFRTFSEFITEEMPKGLLKKLCYDKLIGHYLELFSPAQVLVLPFELMTYEKEDFMQQIFSFLGESLNSEGLDKTKKKINHSTRSNPVIQVNRALNKTFDFMLTTLNNIGMKGLSDSLRWRYYRGKRKFILPVLSQIFKNNPNLLSVPDFAKEKYSPYFQLSNDRLGKMIGVNLRRIGYV